MDLPFLRQLRIVSLIEGVSTLLLFCVAMPLKYFYDMPLAVRIVGSVHGLLFVAMVIMSQLAIERVPLGRRLAGYCMVAAVLPFGPFVTDLWLKRIEKGS